MTSDFRQVIPIINYSGIIDEFDTPRFTKPYWECHEDDYYNNCFDKQCQYIDISNDSYDDGNIDNDIVSQ